MTEMTFLFPLYLFPCAFPPAMTDMEKKLAEYKCDTNEAVCLKLGKSSPTKKNV